MATHDPTKKALAELDALTDAYTRADTALEAARKPLHAAIIKHLTQRSAPPGKIAEHTPYDRNHVGRIGKAAGVPPLRGPNAAPAPDYDAKTEAKAVRELDKLTAAWEAAGAAVEEARKPLHAAIVRHYTERTVTPGVLADHTPYDRNYVGKIIKTAGAPLIRG
ncbi:hypothetical protein ACGFR8_07805 [Streptomyces brevispora]|uniref:hypothetical protein n=1 Tax=Streptomyces brevispora TaxID=887462 RepID=UPI003715B8C1